ncbi:MAG: Transcriptional regulator, contains XRE-family HTH domain [Chloroflexi bacterium]|nr:MAG: Transcriptional regulator, contains XRE-family HTH domain [Chloroflexota bacterium]
MRRARREAGLTQDQLASRVGRKKNWLSDIERGRRGIDVHTLQRIAGLTGHSIEFFTNPAFSEKRRDELLRPVTREDWRLIYADQPDRAAAHASLDEAFRRAQQMLADAGAGAGPGDRGDGGAGDGGTGGGASDAAAGDAGDASG